MPLSRRAVSALLASTAALALVPSGMHAESLPLLKRADWKAKPPAFPMSAHRPQRLTIHHTAVRQRPDSSLAGKLQSMQAFSQRKDKLADGRIKKAWADIPYHFYIDVHGQVAEGREIGSSGDTNTNYDPKGHIGIALEGNFEVESPSQAQEKALTALLTELGKRYRLTRTDISHHQNFASTACPGKALIALIPAIIAATDLPDA